MINHARNLLLNIDGRDSFVGGIGEEVIDPDYRQVTLNGRLLRIRNVLFGANPDRAMLNYRSRQLLTLIHNTSLEEFVLNLDNRVTYTLADNPFSDPTLYDAVVTQTVGGTKQLSYVGGSVPPDATGTAFLQWLVTVDSTTNVETRLLSPLRSVVNAYTITDGVSQLIPLPGVAGSSVRFQSPDVGDQWKVSLLSRPAADLGAILATLQTSGDDAIAEVFAKTIPAGSAEPFKTFRNLWEDHHELGMQLGALVLALIYRTDAIREDV